MKQHSYFLILLHLKIAFMGAKSKTAKGDDSRINAEKSSTQSAASERGKRK
jgi:hypothetical protein